MIRRSISFVLLVGSWCLLVGQGSCGQQDADVEKGVERAHPTVSFVDTDGRQVRFFVEVADSPEERTKGLMFRKELPKDQGMLFVFSHSGRHSFYMKNTNIPLDIIFLDQVGARARVVGILHDMKPLDETSRSIQAPAMAALEVRAGLARENGIQIGTEARISSSP